MKEEEFTQLSMEDQIKKIKQDIEKSGFSTEMKVGSILRNNNVEIIIPSQTYLDKDEMLSREIDFVASTIEQDLDTKVLILVTYVIEVKKAKFPWVIFCKDNHTPHLDPGGLGFKTYHLQVIRHHPNFHNDDLYKLKSPILNNAFLGTSFHEAFKSNKDQSQIYTALMGSLKASLHEVESIKREIESTKNIKHAIIYFVQPLIVLEGQLFKSTIDKNGDIQVEQKHYIPIKLSYSSAKYVENGSKQFYPEIVTLEGLPEYLKATRIWQKQVTFNAKNSL